jgi:hypothetical protein
MKTTTRPTWEVYESGYANWEGENTWHIATQQGVKKGPYGSKEEAQAAADMENAAE